MAEEKSESVDIEDELTFSTDDDNATAVTPGKEKLKEIGGRNGPDPTRYGDWEKNGRCIDF